MELTNPMILSRKAGLPPPPPKADRGPPPRVKADRGPPRVAPRPRPRTTTEDSSSSYEIPPGATTEEDGETASTVDDAGDDAAAVTKPVARKAFRSSPKPAFKGNKEFDRPRGAAAAAKRKEPFAGVQQQQQFRGARGTLKRKRNRETYQQAEDSSGKKKPREPPVVIRDDPIQVAELASKLEKSGAEVVKHMMLKRGVLASLTQSVDAATARQVCEDFGREWTDGGDGIGFHEDVDFGESSLVGEFTDDEASLKPRAPVVTIMGHVDHGKTSLLDAIRETSVAKGETGGITQAIGAYSVRVPSENDDSAKEEGAEKRVTFLDTPGHAAFSEMRSRGANCTDVVVLVVAADDGVKAQTADSIACAKAARVPIVVAVNKMDVEEADASKVETELMAYDLVPEEFGGDTMFARVSAKTKEGIPDLLEKLLLQAELLELKANFDDDARASGVVVEAHVEKGLGVVATTLVRRGKLKVGDPFAAGVAFGRVRAMFDDNGEPVESASPSSAVRVVGWQSDTARIPSAGDAFLVASDDQSARKVADAREALAIEAKAQRRRDVTAKTFSDFKRGAPGPREQRRVTVLVKADTAGAVEALETGLSHLDVQDDVSVVTANVVYSGVGDVTKSDVAIAAVSEPGALVLAFNVGATKDALDDIKTVQNSARHVDLAYYGVIYDALNDVEQRMRVVLSPTPDGDLVGAAHVKALFDIGKLGKVAGCAVDTGYLRRGAKFRVMQGDKIKLKDGKLKTLRNVKVDVDRIEAGSDCGLSFQDYDDFQVGDVIECYDTSSSN